MKKSIALIIFTALFLISALTFVGCQPAEKPNDANPPAENPPAENPPAENPPAENPPAENPPVENPPAENPPAENPPVENPPAEPPIVPEVPDFTVYDQNGNAVRLSDYFGKPIVLNFFATWCSPCRAELPYFQEEYDKNREEVVFLFVSVDNTMEIAKSFADGQGYTFPILHDRSQSAVKAYAIRSIPATYFISREGKLISQRIGKISHEALAISIAQIK
jgi:peroxiredoxin